MYFITTIDSNGDDTRCIGYYSEFEKAEEIVLNNIFDIYETCYDFAIIENIPEGVYCYDDNPVWYKLNNINETYERMNEPPEIYKNQTGFAIG